MPYSVEWPTQFEQERQLLEGILAPWLHGGVHHIGSTSIPGLSAKPIIDMMAGVRDLDEAQAALPVLERHGYLHTPHRPGIAHHFDRRRDGEATHSLHLTEPGSDLWQERLAFRDALRADDELAREYESLKLDLAAQHRDEPERYAQGKRELVARVLALSGLAPGRR